MTARVFARKNINPHSIRDAAIYTHDMILEYGGFIPYYECMSARYFLFKAITSNPAPSPHNHLCELYRICDALGKTNDI